MNYYVDSNGSQGKFELINSNFENLKHWIRLYNYPRTLTAKLVKKIEDRAKFEGKEYDVIHDSLDARLSGIIVGECGVLSMTHKDDETFSINDIIDVGEYDLLINQAYDCFKEAKVVHDDWEKIYISNMDFSQLNLLTEQTIKMLFGESRLNKKGIRKDRFFGAATVNGARDYIDSLTNGLKKRYLIKGRPGTGKSTFLRKIAQYALKIGFDVEVYHCAFDPHSLDMLVFRELEVCLFDSTAPHEYFPSDDRDEIIDVYERAIKSGTDEKYEDEIAKISSLYKMKMEEARVLINKANRCLEKAEERMLPLLDSQKITDTEEKIIRIIFE